MAYTWHGDEFLTKIEAESAKRLEAASIYLENEIKKRISTKSPPVSSPGSPPNVGENRGNHRGGELRRSITHEVHPGLFPVARVGSNKVYARYLEMGTKTMEARPFIESTLQENKQRIEAIIAGSKWID